MDRSGFVKENYRRVLCTLHPHPVTLVVVSKNFSAADIMAVYEEGQREFGENYSQELIEKASQLPADINWHFIGGLQSNKIKNLLKCPGLRAMQTVDSVYKAEQIEKHCVKLGRQVDVFLQVNVSRESNKHGIDPSLVEHAALHILSNMKRCRLVGLMMIGSTRQPRSSEHNPEFELMQTLRDDIERSSGIELSLSMGMSADYLQAIRQGSDLVRVGSAIFGSIPPKCRKGD